MKAIASILLLLSLSGIALSSSDKLAFVFELVRHGARAADSEDPGYFQVPIGMLTSQGMRQRYFLGKVNRQRYIDKYGLLDNTYNPDQIYVQCTGSFRTLQSSYSELLGMYPPSGQMKLSENEIRSLNSGIGLPPIQIRKNEYEGQGLNAFVENLQLIPVFNYGKYGAPQDDEYLVGCSHAWSRMSYYGVLEETFANVSGEILPIIKEPIKIAFNLTDEEMQSFSFPFATIIADYLASETFEGDQKRYNFSAEEIYYIRQVQKYYLLLPIGDQDRQLVITRMMRKPILIIQDRVSQILANTTKSSDLKYLLYSSHDDAVSNFLQFIGPVDHVFIDIPYSSTIYSELHYDDDCLQTKNSTECFTVHVLHNNTPLKFQTCLDANIKRGSQSPICLVDDFIAHYDKLKFTGDVDQACAQPFVPPSQE